MEIPATDPRTANISTFGHLGVPIYDAVPTTYRGADLIAVRSGTPPTVTYAYYLWNGASFVLVTPTAVTLAADADVLLSLSGQELGLDTQTANRVFAGPASGAAADPTFRALVDADMPAEVLHDADFSPAEGIMRKTGAGAYTAMKTNLSAGAAPTVNDDTSQGYVIGSLWVDMTNDRIYMCTDVTTGAAVWKELGGSSVDGIIREPEFWSGGAGYEFWFNAGSTTLISAASATNPHGMPGWGWTCTALAITQDGGAGDFLSTADAAGAVIQLADANDELSSPIIFGSAAHAAMAARFLGATPTKLSLEFYGRWAVNGTNETVSFIGFATGADAAAAGSAGCITVNAANFVLTSDNGSDTGAAKDTAYHKFKITVGSTTTEWFIDDVSQGTITTETDIWPQRLRAFVTNNDIYIAWGRVFYEL